MILIVDDDSNLAENCCMMLEAYGYKVAVASCGKDALAKIAECPPELLISDCCMPGLTGVELSEQLRVVPSSSWFPILLMSGSLQCTAAPGKSYEAFIKKPFLAEHLLIQVRKLLNDSAPSLHGNSAE